MFHRHDTSITVNINVPITLFPALKLMADVTDSLSQFTNQYKQESPAIAR